MGSQNTQPPLVGVPETNQAGFSTTVTDTTLSEALIVLRKRKLILIIAVLLGLIYGIYSAESQPKLYESYGRIQVRSGSSNEYKVSAVQGYGGGDSNSKMLSEIEILKSDSLMLTVCREMDLANNADFLGGKLLTHAPASKTERLGRTRFTASRATCASRLYLRPISSESAIAA